MLRPAILLALLGATAPAAAESVWVGGLEGADHTRVAYLARVAPFPGQVLGDGWAYAVAIDRVHYEYTSAAGRIDGESSSLKALVLRELALQPGTLALGAGVAYRDVTLSPSDPGNDAAGSHAEPLGELQWRSRPDAPWATQVHAQYVGGADSHHANAFLGRRLRNGIALGAQVSTGGDPSYSVHGLSLALRGWKRGAVEWSFHVGAQHQAGEGTSPAIGIGFVTYRP